MGIEELINDLNDLDEDEKPGELPLVKYANIICNLSLPVKRIHDYKWVYENIEELNPYNKHYVRECKQVCRKMMRRSETAKELLQ